MRSITQSQLKPENTLCPIVKSAPSVVLSDVDTALRAYGLEVVCVEDYWFIERRKPGRPD